MYPDMCIHWICISIHLITIPKLHLQIPHISSHLKCTRFNFYFNADLLHLSRSLKIHCSQCGDAKGPVDCPLSQSCLALKLPPQKRTRFLTRPCPTAHQKIFL